MIRVWTTGVCLSSSVRRSPPATGSTVRREYSSTYAREIRRVASAALHDSCAQKVSDQCGVTAESPGAGAKPSDFVPNASQRQFDVGKPNRVWVTNITHIQTWEGWLCLAVVMDLFWRKIVGWAVAAIIGGGLVLHAVMIAVRKRLPRKPLIHSDQGSRHGSGEWLRFCGINGLTLSMSRRGNCWDNTVADSFFSGSKKELIKENIYKNRSMARDAIRGYIDAFYYSMRWHRHLGGVSPEVLEAVGSRR